MYMYRTNQPLSERSIQLETKKLHAVNVIKGGLYNQN